VLGLQHANISSEVKKIFYGCTIGSSLAQFSAQVALEAVNAGVD
jgi:hypothetical protein